MAAGPDHREGHAERGAEIARDHLALVLGLLVVVVGLDRRILVGRGLRDAAVHADGRALHETLDAGLGRLLDDVADAIDVDVPIGLLRDIGRPVESRDVLHDLDAVERALETFAIQEIAGHQLQVWMREARCAVRRPVHAACRDAFPRQVLAEPGPGEAICPRDEDLRVGGLQATRSFSVLCRCSDADLSDRYSASARAVFWGEQPGSNRRPPEPQSGALTS